MIKSVVEIFQEFNEDKQETPPKKKIKLESNERIREITDCLNCSFTQGLIDGVSGAKYWHFLVGIIPSFFDAFFHAFFRLFFSV